MKTLPLTIEIRTPDGQPFTADHVTLADLRRFRDLRGTSHGNWTFRLHGEKDAAAFEETPVQDGNLRVRAGKGFVRIAVEETVAAKSAPPLVADTLTASERRRYNFDLFRLGTLVARARSRHGMPGMPTRKQLTLRDPDNAVVASGGGGLHYSVTPQALDKSRDGDGNPRLWSLEAGENVGPVAGLDVDVSATVMAETRISSQVLQDRINAIIGEHGEKISIYMEERSKDLLVRMKILDEVSAESIDMWGLLDSRIDSVPQDEGVTKDIAVGIAYNLYNKSRYLKDEDGKKLYVRLYDMKVSYLKIAIGASVEIPHAIPALTIDVGIEGYAMVKALLDDLAIDVASVKIRDNHIRLEAGLRLDINGSFVAETWMRDDPLDIDVATHWTQQVAVIMANVYVGILATVTQETVTEFLESELNSGLRQYFRDAVEDAMNNAPQILAALLGDDFTYRGLRLDGDDIVFSYVAPLEADPKPSEGYVGIIGRSAIHTGPTLWEMTPPTLGDTWSARNLAKIDHIVMVMMENRSFDHVLGYRAQMPGMESDGLTQDLVDFLNSLEFPDLDPTTTKFPIEWLGSEDSDIPENSVHKKTALPRHVGHSLTDVADQLMLDDEHPHIQTPSGRWINSPMGFIRNFNEERANGLARKDVLGYYEADDLPFFGFLAANYAYCEKYFCSHPGPTLPNRMFSLGGDVQYDRTGEAILNNNTIGGDDFYLSRALTIFDLLDRKGIRWRVYESFPSLTMLRFFARYAGDNTNIVPIGKDASRLKEDVARHSETPFPSVVFIDPAFHHHPQNDDHPEDERERPVVDMWRGQQFLKDVYDALVSNREVWSKTLLIITYDEHGGLYDHVIPPLAEGLFQPPVMGRGGMGTAVSSMEIRYGLRVPTFVVSPWVPAGKGEDIVLDHCSILKTIIARFLGTKRHRLGGVFGGRGGPFGGRREVYYTYPFLSDRVNASRSFDAYLSAPEPRLDVPPSPVMATLAPEAPPRRARAIITNVLSRAQMRRGNVNFHDLTGRLARQLGR
jgi:phospholipase C